MILFVFEGSVAEPQIFESMNKLYFSQEEVKIICCKHDLPTLYSRLVKYGYDLFRILPLQENGIIIPKDKRIDTLFSQIFLFFDYDFQHHGGLDYINNILAEMLDFFDDETDKGKLYINYPMVESLKYTKQMPDNDYYHYIVTREDCVQHKFKCMAETFAYSKAKAFRFIDLTKTEEQEIISNWELLKSQNVKKANYIVNEIKDYPINKNNINQGRIFSAQKTKYVNISETVAILNSFPIFLYDYFKSNTIDNSNP